MWRRKVGDLFPKTGDFRVVRLCAADARGLTEHLNCLRGLVLENQPFYPDIEKWFDKKVVPGISSSERIGYVGYLDEKPAVSAIVKRGEFAKFCHLRIKEELQGINLGEAFFALMGLEVRGSAKEVHFTLPEGLWEKKNKFFKSFGFSKPVKAGHQYRLFEDELRCSLSFDLVWKGILEKLPKIARALFMDGRSLDKKLLMSIRAEHARKVLSGTKKVEIRRKFSKKWTGCKVSIYSSGREHCLVGEASISKVVVGEPERVWDKFGDQIGCTRNEFNRYAESSSEIYAIVFEEVVPYRERISLRDISNLTKKQLRPPQSYCDLGNNVNWAEAVSMGALLQNCFRIQEPVLL
jgi:predicted transcriptional regulator